MALVKILTREKDALSKVAGIIGTDIRFYTNENAPDTTTVEIDCDRPEGMWYLARAFANQIEYDHQLNRIYNGKK
jgi:hypothetical protein